MLRNAAALRPSFVPPIRSKLLMDMSRRLARFKNAFGRGEGSQPSHRYHKYHPCVPNPLGPRLSHQNSPVPSGIGVRAATASARKSCSSGKASRVACRSLSLSLSLSHSLSRSLSFPRSVLLFLSHTLSLSLALSLPLSFCLSVCVSHRRLSGIP